MFSYIPVMSKSPKSKELEKKIFGNTTLREKIEFHRLVEAKDDKWFKQAVKWSFEKWGYLREYKIDYYQQELTKIKDDLYIMTYNNKPIGMFSLTDCAPNKAINELDYVYVAEEFRGFGLGSLIINKVFALAKEQNLTAIVLDTLTPKLNSFYQKYGARVICDSEIDHEKSGLGFPTSYLVFTEFSLPPKRKEALYEKPVKHFRSSYTL